MDIEQCHNLLDNYLENNVVQTIAKYYNVNGIYVNYLGKTFIVKDDSISRRIYDTSGRYCGCRWGNICSYKH